MYIKLNFTSNKNTWSIFRILDDIIRTPSITSAAALSTRMTSLPYGNNLASGFDAANSEIIRTVDLATTKSHLYVVGVTSSQTNNRWTLEFSNYDNTDIKYYLQFQPGAASYSAAVVTIGSAITGGTMNSASFEPTSSDTVTPSAGTQGTLLTLGGNATGNQPFVTHTNIRTVWCYINDKCMILSFTLGTTFNNGWGSTFFDSTKQTGPYIFSQYTRYDYFNTNNNGIIPLCYSNVYKSQYTSAFGQPLDYTSIFNENNSFNISPLRIFNTVNALPAVTTSWPIVYHPNVIHGAGLGDCSTQILNAISNSSGSTAGASYGKVFNSSASTRYPTVDLSGTAFGIQPLTWTNSLFGNMGGNLSDQSGFYLFNGDYAPGDEFGLNNKTWSVWPLYNGFADRIGLAIPKE